eukprot:752722-Hanusia_phi.AAC.3
MEPSRAENSETQTLPPSIAPLIAARRAVQSKYSEADSSSGWVFPSAMAGWRGLLPLMPALLLPYSLARAQNRSSTCSQHASALSCLSSRAVNSILRELNPDPDQHRYTPNQQAREVSSGHYVLVLPTPLPHPKLVAYSTDTLRLIGLQPADAEQQEFASLFAGDLQAVPGFLSSWATPYALSIYGEEIVPDGAGRSGNGYGDGRAISIAEIEDEVSGRWELQLKGAGRTPFCRGGDGRAVLRSSIREFLASEAMHALGVPTTRALCLVASGSEQVRRPWYRDTAEVADANGYINKHGGNVLQAEQCAITTRVARSFIRVSQFELYGRRARGGDDRAREELLKLVMHTIGREFPQLNNESQTSTKIVRMAREVGERLARMATEWIRVGYVQSNFNSDNCLVSGATMDYGPFGFIERFDPSWGMWIGAGDHFSFLNQLNAAKKNFESFAKSLFPLLGRGETRSVQAIIQNFTSVAQDHLDGMFARKMGLTGRAGELWTSLEDILTRHPTDFTIFWRQLSLIPRTIAGANSSMPMRGKGEAALQLLEPAWYRELAGESKDELERWIARWLTSLQEEGRAGEEVSRDMLQVNPKYIPREWMLAQAYRQAQEGDLSVLQDMMEVFAHPYDEMPSYSDRFIRLPSDHRDFYPQILSPCTSRQPPQRRTRIHELILLDSSGMLSGRLRPWKSFHDDGQAANGPEPTTCPEEERSTK